MNLLILGVSLILLGFAGIRYNIAKNKNIRDWRNHVYSTGLWMLGVLFIIIYLR